MCDPTITPYCGRGVWPRVSSDERKTPVPPPNGLTLTEADLLGPRKDVPFIKVKVEEAAREGFCVTIARPIKIAEPGPSLSRALGRVF